MKPIPISAARRIAEEYGYDQVVIIARKVGEGDQPHGEHVTTYGVDKSHCEVAARTGDFLKYRVMKWRAEGDGTRLNLLLHEAASAELEFLKSLLPKGES